MPKVPPPKQSKAKKRSLLAKPGGPATLAEVNSIQTRSKQDHGCAANTTKKYAKNVERARAWLHHYLQPNGSVDPLQKGIGNDIGVVSADDSIYDDPEFRNALDDILNRYSDKALALFLSYKVFHENQGQQTCDGAYSAFKRLWTNVYVPVVLKALLDVDPSPVRDGDTYCGKWEFNESRKRWEGNLALSAEVQDVREAVKHKCGAEGGDWKHSLAMSKEHMETMFEWSESTCLESVYNAKATSIEEQALRTKHLQFRAFASMGWTVWSRCGPHNAPYTRC